MERTVGKVAFEGNRVLDRYTLGISIATSGPRGFFLLRWFGGGERRPFDEIEFRRDVLRIQLLYRLHGYFEARVDTVVRRTNGSVDVAFRIVEGPPVIVDSIEVLGVDSILEQGRLVRRLPLRVGRPFSRVRFEASADTIVATLRNRGYPFPEVYRNYSVERVTRLARVEFEVLPGARARVGEIVASGSSQVSTRTIRRALGFEEGDVFNQQKLVDAQLALYRTDLFRYANVAIPDRQPLVGGVDSLVRVAVQVADAPRARLRAGAGYGTYDCLRTSTAFSWVNFTGGARRLDLTTRVSKIGAADPLQIDLDESVCGALRDDPFSDTLNYYADLTLTQPSLLARRVSLGFSLFAERTSEFNAYERVAAGGAVSAGIPAGRVPVTLTYRLERSRTNAGDAIFCITFDQCEASTVAQLKAYRRQATLTLSATDARTNSPIDPTQGRILSAQLATSSPELGSEVAYDKVLAEAAWFRPIGRRWVGALRLRAGAVRAGTVTVNDTTFRYIPPNERFYAGGPTSVRGFGRNEMGPVVYVADTVTADPVAFPDSALGLRASPLGSNAIALVNLEVRAPSPVLPARLGFVLFVDAAQLWEQTTGGFVPSGVRVTPGAGMRFATPLGPMRLDIAYNRYPSQAGRLYEVRGDTLVLRPETYPGPARGTGFLDRLTWHFSVGQAF